MSADAENTDPAKARFQALAESASAPQVVQLPLWPDDRRGAPNAILRSAVFSAGKPASKRVVHDDALLPILPPYAVYYSGPQLYQPDLDVWLELLHRCRLTPLGLSATVSMRSLLRGLGRAQNEKSHLYTLESARALTKATINARRRDARGRLIAEHAGHLLEEFLWDAQLGVWTVKLNQRIAAMFAPDEHTWLGASARRELGKGYLAKWLHGYFSTHREPHPISVERLRDLSGTSTKQLRDFRGALRRALAEVARVERADGRRFEWRVVPESDLVEVSRD
jgi:TrfA protein